MESIISALTGGAVTLIVCIINNTFQNRRTMAEFNAQSAKTNALIEYKLDELTKRVDKHNHVIERMYALEKVNDLQEEKIKVINHRIEDLEKAVV